MTSRFRGGGHKRLYRVIDFKRNKIGVPGKVVRIEYDPNRSARIALIACADGEKRYILSPVGLSVGDVVQDGLGSDVRPGNALPLSSIPLGTTIHNVELKPGKGGAIGTECRRRGSGDGTRRVVRSGSIDFRRDASDSRDVYGDRGTSREF